MEQENHLQGLSAFLNLPEQLVLEFLVGHEQREFPDENARGFSDLNGFLSYYADLYGACTVEEALGHVVRFWYDRIVVRGEIGLVNHIFLMPSR